MKLCASCIRCFVDRQEQRVAGQKDEETRAAYMKELCAIVAEAAEDDSVPVLVERINRVYRRLFGPLTDYAPIKKGFNELMLAEESALEERVRAAADPFRQAMLFARAANYIDFGAFSHIDHEVLFALLERAAQEELDQEVYERLCAELDRARSLVYVTDNCGEVVLDKLAIRLLKERWPQIEVTALVRGQEALNDVTREDAAQVGLDSVARIADNGCGVAGTPIAHISKEARTLLEGADVILAKGQGNFETMHGCSLNVFYSFLCKCDWFQKRFGLPLNSGVLTDERSAAARFLARATTIE